MPPKKSFRKKKPYKKYGKKPYKKYYKKKYGKTGKYRAKLGKSVGMTSIPFPFKTFTTFTWSDSRLLLAGTAGTVASYQYTANDIYDPNYTGTGIQPKWYDTFLGPTGGVQPYRTFKVHASKIKVTFFSYTASTTSDCICFIGNQPQYSQDLMPVDMEDILTNEYIYTRPLGQTGNQKPLVMKKFIKTKKQFGISFLDDDKYAGSYNTSPSTRSLWNVGVLAVDSTARANVQIVVQIKYFVELSGLNLPADS